MDILIVVFCLLYIGYELFAIFNREEITAVTNTKIKLNELNVPMNEYYCILARKFGKAFMTYLTIIDATYMIFCITTLFTKYLYIGLVLIALAILEVKVFSCKNKIFKIIDSIICIMILSFAVYQAMLGVI